MAEPNQEPNSILENEENPQDLVTPETSEVNDAGRNAATAGEEARASEEEGVADMAPEAASEGPAGEEQALDATENMLEGTPEQPREAADTKATMGEEGNREVSLLTTESFTDGEGAELDTFTAEPVSREGSIVPDHREVEDEEGLPALGPDNPERENHTPAPESPIQVKEEETALSINYEEHMELLQELQAERERLSLLNGQLQAKLADYFRRKTANETRPDREHKKAILDQEQRYQKYMDIMEGLKQQHARDSNLHQQQMEALRLQTQERLGQVGHEWRTFMAQKQEVVLSVLPPRLGKQVLQAEAERLQIAEQKHEDALVAVRLQNIKLKNQIGKLEAQLRAKEELGEGLHLIDFEQLKIENQTYNEKIEERNEELLKLRRKVTNTVQVLTHVKEKLQFVQLENQAGRAQLADADAVVARKRDVLTRTKQARDGLRSANQSLRQRCGLLGNVRLLRDLEVKVDTSEALEQRLDALRRRHAELLLRCAGVKDVLERSKHMAH